MARLVHSISVRCGWAISRIPSAYQHQDWNQSTFPELFKDLNQSFKDCCNPPLKPILGIFKCSENKISMLLHFSMAPYFEKKK